MLPPSACTFNLSKAGPNWGVDILKDYLAIAMIIADQFP
jgi:hypothetical protein